MKKAIEGFPEIVKYQIVVSRSDHRDELTLTIELKQDDVNKNELNILLQKRIKNCCLLKIDEIIFADSGTIIGEKILIDKRIWD